jgi:hypothetical protein
MYQQNLFYKTKRVYWTWNRSAVYGRRLTRTSDDADELEDIFLIELNSDILRRIAFQLSKLLDDLANCGGLQHVDQSDFECESRACRRGMSNIAVD